MRLDIILQQVPGMDELLRLGRFKTKEEHFPSFLYVQEHILSKEEFIELIAKPLKERIENSDVVKMSDVTFMLTKVLSAANVKSVNNFIILYNNIELIINATSTLNPYNEIVYSFEYLWGRSVSTASSDTVVMNPVTLEITEFQNNQDCTMLEILEGLFEEHGTRISVYSPSDLGNRTRDLLDNYDSFGWINPNSIHILLHTNYTLEDIISIQGEVLQWMMYVDSNIEEEMVVGDIIDLTIEFNGVEGQHLSLPRFIQMIKDREIALVRFEVINEKPVYVWTFVKLEEINKCNDVVAVRHFNELNAIESIQLDDVNDIIYMFINY